MRQRGCGLLESLGYPDHVRFDGHKQWHVEVKGPHPKLLGAADFKHRLERRDEHDEGDDAAQPWG